MARRYGHVQADPAVAHVDEDGAGEGRVERRIGLGRRERILPLLQRAHRFGRFSLPRPSLAGRTQGSRSSTAEDDAGDPTALAHAGI